MQKRDIVLRISQETGIKQVIVKKIVQKTLDIILESLTKRQNIELRNFGVFKVKMRKKRIGRNPKTGEVVVIPPQPVVVFKPGLKMRKAFK
ncbi:MAG: HU family DNA-binding protein [Candidatus Omnitrophica bacterium]|nr:HU family DNA-binding protein [Candidatus Omnitrophota bacterium]MCM8831168.1 HU family DNA-binding protein [Candidatus Omnitrophota bacterium]